jgi:hypothetical protein
MKKYIRTMTLRVSKSIDNPRGVQRELSRRAGYVFEATDHEVMSEYLVEADGTLHLKRFCKELKE